MKVKHPVTGRTYHFADKCLPFGVSISCALFNRVSIALKHIVQVKTGRNHAVVNYLDDFLFIDISKVGCNYLLRRFLNICEIIKFPVSADKTEWACQQVVFLGILLDGHRHVLVVPNDKRLKALHLVQKYGEARKATVRQLQSLAGMLNFLNRAVVPGRIFMRRMYAKFSYISVTDHKKLDKQLMKQKGLKQHHHVSLDKEFRDDCKTWAMFLSNAHAMARPFVDLKANKVVAEEIDFYSDASASEKLCFGCVYGPAYLFGVWELGFIRKHKPSIAFLKLFALCAGVLAWGKYLKNARLTIFCDNKGVCDMINFMGSKCPKCMYLLRLLTLDNLVHNIQIFFKYVDTKSNSRTDALSHLKFEEFFNIVGDQVDCEPTPIPEAIWPLSKLWQEI